MLAINVIDFILRSGYYLKVDYEQETIMVKSILDLKPTTKYIRTTSMNQRRGGF